MTADTAALALARDLIRRPSITPTDAGCQALAAERLAAAGFEIETMPCCGVDNLWAIARGRGGPGPLLCFAGHTDVVPPGPLADWRFEPFAAEIHDGWLYGRGAADMKSSVAAMICAAECFRAAHPAHRGSLAIVLTSDEEGPAVNGTRAVVERLAERGVTLDYCVVGEPSSQNSLADVVKHGRRGSLNARIVVRGRQGHVAYPQHADNALHRLLPLLAELADRHWDDGDADFPPTSFQISNIEAGTGAENVIPGSAEARFNLRFNPMQTADGLRRVIETRCRAHGLDRPFLDWQVSGEPFITRGGVLIERVQQAIAEINGRPAILSTSGGTSDGRYIAPTGAEVLELGPSNATIHQIDERIPAADVEHLTALYERIMRKILA